MLPLLTYVTHFVRTPTSTVHAVSVSVLLNSTYA
jgi:hypothetical protein